MVIRVQSRFSATLAVIISRLGARHLLSAAFIVSFVLVCLPGCAIDDDKDIELGYNTDARQTGFGLIRTGQVTPSGFSIVMDDGFELYPVNDYSYDNLRNGDRVMVKYLITEPSVANNMVFKAHIMTLTKIFYKDIAVIGGGDADMGEAPVHVKEIWAVKNMLTFQLEFMGSGTSHSVALVRFTDSADYDDKAQPVALELRHDDFSDQRIYRITTFVTFDLGKLRVEGLSTVSYVVTWKDYDDHSYDYHGTYTY